MEPRSSVNATSVLSNESPSWFCPEFIVRSSCALVMFMSLLRLDYNGYFVQVNAEESLRMTQGF